MKLEPKQSPETKPVARTATQGTWFLLSLPKNLGAWPSMAKVYSSLVPANRAWFPADKTLVRMTALMTLPAALAPVIWKTMVKGEVRVSLELRLG
jgi:hypothetical protein